MVDGGQGCLPLMDTMLTALTGLGDKRASHPPHSPPRTVAQSPAYSFRAPRLMFSLSGTCRDKVAPLYHLRRFPGEID